MVPLIVSHKEYININECPHKDRSTDFCVYECLSLCVCASKDMTCLSVSTSVFLPVSSFYVCDFEYWHVCVRAHTHTHLCAFVWMCVCVRTLIVENWRSCQLGPGPGSHIQTFTAVATVLWGDPDTLSLWNTRSQLIHISLRDNSTLCWLRIWGKCGKTKKR